MFAIVLLIEGLLAVPIQTVPQAPPIRVPKQAPMVVSDKPKEPEVKWLTDYTEARKEATDKKLPMLVVIGTENCLHCKRLDKTLGEKEVAERLTKFVCVKIDADKEPKLASAFQAVSYPTVAVGTHDGKVVSFTQGFMDSSQVTNALKKVDAPVIEVKPKEVTPVKGVGFRLSGQHDPSRSHRCRECGREVTVVTGAGPLPGTHRHDCPCGNWLWH